VTREKEKKKDETEETDDSDIDIVEDIEPATEIAAKGTGKGIGKAQRLRG